MEKIIINKEIEKQLYENGFTKTLEYINKTHNLNNKCILLSNYEISAYYNKLPVYNLYKIIFIESGHFICDINNVNYDIEPGDVLLIPPFVSYDLNSKKSECKFISIFSPEEYIKYFNTSSSNLLTIFNKVKSVNNFQIKVRPTFKTRINSSISMLEEYFLSNDFGDDVLFNATFSALITRMNKGITFYDVDNYFVTYSLIITQINNYINANIDKKILIADVANHVGLSESRISHIYKEHMGIGITQYIIKKRLSIAKDMLKIGHSLYDVSIKCGFQDYSSFLRSFKKAYDISPKAYQNQYYKN